MLRVFLGEGDAWEVLRQAVGLVWGLETLPKVARLADGKPVFSQRPELHFNVSHSGSLVLCALSDQPVGVDLELIRPRREGLPTYIFKAEELERYRTLGGDWPAFYTLWTEKESILKYTGEGLKGWRRTSLPEGCVMTNLSGDGWRGAVCGHEQAEKEQILCTTN